MSATAPSFQCGSLSFDVLTTSASARNRRSSMIVGLPGSIRSRGFSVAEGISSPVRVSLAPNGLRAMTSCPIRLRLAAVIE